MTTTFMKRIKRLEGDTTPREHRQALLVIHGTDNDPDSLIGVYGLNVPRMVGESAGDFMARLEAHVRATRGNALPFVGIAAYDTDTDE